MAAAERSSITNAIWLCRNCHKAIDADPKQYPAALLFEWRLEHERLVSEQLGKAGSELRRKVIGGQLKGFEDASYLARQIVIDKPRAWEFRLMTELLRSKLDPLLARWRALERGLSVRRIKRLARGEELNWFGDRISELGKLAPALSGIINQEFEEACGKPGEPGSPGAILRACNLFEEACQLLLSWEEDIRFTAV